MKLILLLVLVAIGSSKFMRENHDYWYTAGQAAGKSGAPSHIDKAWNYCDYKCLYFETIVGSGVDFMTIEFRGKGIKSVKPNFAACYAKKDGKLALWNTVIKNAWFE